MPMDNNTNKLINNGYLRTPYITKNNGHGTNTNTNSNSNSNATVTGVTSKRTNNVDAGGGGGVVGNIKSTEDDNDSDAAAPPTVISPLLGVENKSELSTTEVMHQSSLLPQQHQQQQQLHQQRPLLPCANNVGHTLKHPTVVYLDADSGKTIPGSGGVVVNTTLQHNVPVAYSPQTSSHHHHQSEWLIKESTLRCRLLVLAVALTVLGAAIGALAIYFAGGNYRCQTATHTIDKSRNINTNNISTTGLTYDRDDICLWEECVRTAAYLLSAMDTTANPCENFFQYACGTWNKVHIIPEDRSSISTFEVLADQQQVILKGVLEEPINDEDNQATIKAKMFYKSCIDIPQIRKVGEGRLKDVLKSLGGWPVIEPEWSVPNMTVEELIGILRGTYGEPVLIELYVGADDKNSSIHVLQIDQFPLALPSRDYYLKSSSEQDLKAYHRYMTQTAILMGANPVTAAQELNDVLQLEVKLVNATLPEADRHDTSAIYRKINLKELQAEVPQINWTLFLQTALGKDIVLKEDEELVSYAMPYLVDMGKILKETDRRVLHNYVLWRLVMSIMTHMIDDYQKERVEFRKILLGIQTERVRWSQCVDWTNKKLGMAVGTLFIRDNFNQNSKDTALEMIHTIREAFNELLSENHWMDDETRAVAKEKADTMNERIGYPEILTDAKELEKEFANLSIVPDNFMENVLSILKWESEKNMQLLRQPVDKEKWTTEPAVVNAFYNPNKNDIVFPAGILQPLFYSQHFPKSLNYGGIGVVIGHEITHGFDDKGRQFDKDGNMMQWWNNATIEAFRERTQCIIDQYSKYKIDEVGLFMNGRMTQGENIADNGGLKQAFRAYKKWVQRHGPEQRLPGLNLTHDQLFFLNYAQIWCGSMRPEDALTKIRSSVHSPGSIRVLGPLSNSKDFAEAYQCELGSPMNPLEKCSVW